MPKEYTRAEMISVASTLLLRPKPTPNHVVVYDAAALLIEINKTCPQYQESPPKPGKTFKPSGDLKHTPGVKGKGKPLPKKSKETSA